MELLGPAFDVRQTGGPLNFIRSKIADKEKYFSASLQTFQNFQLLIPEVFDRWPPTSYARLTQDISAIQIKKRTSTSHGQGFVSFPTTGIAL